MINTWEKAKEGEIERGRERKRQGSEATASNNNSVLMVSPEIHIQCFNLCILFVFFYDCYYSLKLLDWIFSITLDKDQNLTQSLITTQKKVVFKQHGTNL